MSLSKSTDGRAWRMLALLSLAELLGMSLWFTASSVAPYFAQLWDLSADRTAALTTAVQVGFVAGTALAALANLADLVPSRIYFTVSCLLAALANGLLVLTPSLHSPAGYAGALVCRFATGFFLAGVYPPAMKMIAGWFARSRGLAIGTLVGALTVGKATPYLLKTIEGVVPRELLLVTSASAVLAGLLVAIFYREGPFAFERKPFSMDLVATVWAHRGTRSAIFGYLGHMWELYAMWTWIPAFLAASALASGHGSAAASAVAFGAIAAGGLGCVWGGWAADRMGRIRLVNLAMGISGACSLGIGFFFGGPLWLLAPLTWIWGFFVVADSAQFSAMVTEVCPRHGVGTALTLQTSLGFLLTGVTIHLVPRLVDSAGWAWAFPILALGPAAGITAMRRAAAGNP